MAYGESVDIEQFIKEFRSDELGNMLYLEVAEIISREQTCESVDELIARIIQTKE